MIVVFALAIVVPFPGGRRTVSDRRPDADLDRPCAPGRRRRAAARPPAARHPAGLCPVLGLHLRRPHARRARGDPALRRRARARRARLVAHLGGRPVLQQHAPLEHRAVLLLHGRPPVGEVLHGRLARQACDDVDDGRGRVPRLDRDRVHRLPVPAEPRLAVDRRPGEGRAERIRHRRVLQRSQLRTDADVAHRPAAARRRGAGWIPHPARASQRVVPPL